MTDEIEAIHEYERQHATCDIQQHPWQAVFGAGFDAGRARQREEVDRLNRLVETLSRAIGRYQDEESVPAPGSHPFIPLSGSQDTSGEYTRCSVMGCTQARIQHPGEW